MADESGVLESTETGLLKLLNQHGHGFHFAVMRAADALGQTQKSRWRLVGTEIPVIARESTTHIDFILKQISEANPIEETFLIAECKRVSNKFARWCFARVPYTPSSQIVFERFSCNHEKFSGNTLINMNTMSGTVTSPAYGLGLELKHNGDSNDGPGSNRSAINESIAQVLRGVSGFINHQLGGKNRRDGSLSTLRFVPVIFTTATLFVTDADLGNADIKTGNLESLHCREIDWIWFNYNRSPMLAHDFDLEQITNRKDLAFQFVRSVAIVSVSGVERFLGTPTDYLLGA